MSIIHTREHMDINSLLTPLITKPCHSRDINHNSIDTEMGN